MQVCAQYTMNPTRFHHKCALVQSVQHQLPDLYVTPYMWRYQLHWSAKKIFCSLLKFRVILTVLTLLNPNMTPKLPDHPPMVREEIKFKNYICNKKSNIMVFNCNIQCILSDNERCPHTQHPTYKKNSLYTHFVFFCLLYSPDGDSLLRLQQQSANILHYTAFQFGKYPDGTFCHVHQRWPPCFQGDKKNPNGNTEN